MRGHAGVFISLFLIQDSNIHTLDYISSASLVHALTFSILQPGRVLGIRPGTWVRAQTRRIGTDAGYEKNYRVGSG